MPRLTVRGCSFHYELDDFTPPWQPAETIWIQHGYGRSSRFWRHWVTPFAGQYRVLRLDLRGHGQSDDPGPDFAWTVDGLLADMLGVMDGLGLEKVHYFGESLGGVLGLAFASRWPERLKSLATCSSPIAIPAASTQAATGLASQATAFATLSIAEWTRSTIRNRGVTVLSPEHEEWVIHEWEKNRIHVLAGLAELIATVDLAPILPEVRVPTLLLSPTRSPLTSLSEQARMRAAIPNARMSTIEGSGHEIYVDRADECIAAYKAFLTGLA